MAQLSFRSDVFRIVHDNVMGYLSLIILPGRQLGVRSSIYLYSESSSAHSRYIVSALT